MDSAFLAVREYSFGPNGFGGYKPQWHVGPRGVFLDGELCVSFDEVHTMRVNGRYAPTSMEFETADELIVIAEEDANVFAGLLGGIGRMARHAQRCLLRTSPNARIEEAEVPPQFLIWPVVCCLIVAGVMGFVAIDGLREGRVDALPIGMLVVYSALCVLWLRRRKRRIIRA